jgi:hypothetical protein
MSTRLFAVVGACVTAVALAADPAPVVTREFKIVTVTESESFGTKSTDESEERYAWQRTGKERGLFLREMITRDQKPGGKTWARSWSRAVTITTENGKVTKEEKFDDLPEDRKKVARALFDNPLCKLEVDETGKVVKRTDTVPEEALKGGVNQLVTVVMLFHPPYHATKDRWEGDASLVRDPRVPASGKLEYTKVAGGKGGRAVQVAGKLRSKFPPDNIKDFKDDIPVAKFVLTGKLTFDEERGEWIAGKLEIETETEWIRPGKGDGSDPPNRTDKGKLTITFELLPEKKK